MTAEYKVSGDVAVITLKNPPVNGLSHATRLGISQGLPITWCMQYAPITAGIHSAYDAYPPKPLNQYRQATQKHGVLEALALVSSARPPARVPAPQAGISMVVLAACSCWHPAMAMASSSSARNR